MCNISESYQHLKNKILQQANQAVNRAGVLKIIEDIIEWQNDCDWYVINAEPLVADRSIASSIYVGSNSCLPAIRIKEHRVIFMQQKNKIIRQHVPYLKVLDFLVLWQKAGNADFERLVFFLSNEVKDMSHEERRLIANLSRKYKPFIRAILALTLKNIGERNLFSKVIQTISPAVLKKYNWQFLYIT